jgi:hypothetical protein
MQKATQSMPEATDFMLAATDSMFAAIFTVPAPTIYG